jgi:hypothetical protein
MRHLVIACLGAILLFSVGCKKSPPPETKMPAPLQPLTPSDGTPPPAPDPTASQTAAPVAATAMDTETTLVTLNSMVSDFSMSRKRLPNGIEELVALKLLPAVPEAPPGKKYVIDPQSRRVVLANK